MTDFLFPLLKNFKSGVDDRGHRLRITHTRLERFILSSVGEIQLLKGGGGSRTSAN